MDRKSMRSAWSTNSDGAGYMFVANGSLVIRKPFFKLKQLVAAYEKDHKRYGTESPFVIHFRLSTHGSNSKLNTHPHSLAAGTVGMAHNGILHNFVPALKNESDTVFFARTVLEGRSMRQLMDPKWGKTLEGIIGWGNKLVFLDRHKNLLIVNESRGDWNGMSWYSNDSWTWHTKVWESRWNTYPTAKFPKSERESDADKLDEYAGCLIDTETGELFEYDEDDERADLSDEEKYALWLLPDEEIIHAAQQYVIHNTEAPFSIDHLTDRQYKLFTETCKQYEDWIYAAIPGTQSPRELET